MIFYFIALPLCSLQSLVHSSLLIFYLFLSLFLFTHSSPSLFFASLARWQEPLSSAKHKLKVLLSSISPSFSSVSIPTSSLSILLLPLSIYLAIGQRWCHHLPLAPVNNLLEGSIFTVSWGARKCSHVHENTHLCTVDVMWKQIKASGCRGVSACFHLVKVMNASLSPDAVNQYRRKLYFAQICKKDVNMCLCVFGVCVSIELYY